MRKVLLLSAMLLSALSACARNIVTTPPARCADLIPEDWKEPVPGAAIPTVPNNATPIQIEQIWTMAFVEQAGQLAKANGRTADAIGIMKRCETMVNEARPD